MSRRIMVYTKRENDPDSRLYTVRKSNGIVESFAFRKLKLI